MDWRTRIKELRDQAIPEIATNEETALVVARKNAPALASGLSRLLADRDLAARLGAAARRRVVERHSLATMLDRMEAIFSAAFVVLRREFPTKTTPPTSTGPLPICG